MTITPGLGIDTSPHPPQKAHCVHLAGPGGGRCCDGAPHPVPPLARALLAPQCCLTRALEWPAWGCAACICCGRGPTPGRMGSQRCTPATRTVAFASSTLPHPWRGGMCWLGGSWEQPSDTSGQACLPHARVLHAEPFPGQAGSAEPGHSLTGYLASRRWQMWCDHTQEPCGGWAWSTCPTWCQGKVPGGNQSAAPLKIQCEGHWPGGPAVPGGRDLGWDRAGLAEHRACSWHHCPSWPGTYSVSRRVMLSPRQGLPRIPQGHLPGGLRWFRAPTGSGAHRMVSGARGWAVGGL